VSADVDPDHLVVWSTGVGPDRDDPVVLDHELAEGFPLAEWSLDVRAGRPAAVVATAYERPVRLDPCSSAGVARVG